VLVHGGVGKWSSGSSRKYTVSRLDWVLFSVGTVTVGNDVNTLASSVTDEG